MRDEMWRAWQRIGMKPIGTSTGRVKLIWLVAKCERSRDGGTAWSNSSRRQQQKENVWKTWNRLEGPFTMTWLKEPSVFFFQFSFFTCWYMYFHGAHIRFRNFPSFFPSPVKYWHRFCLSLAFGRADAIKNSDRWYIRSVVAFFHCKL